MIGSRATRGFCPAVALRFRRPAPRSSSPYFTAFTAMPTLMSACPAVALLLPALVLLSAVVFLTKGDRRSFRT